MDREDAAEVVEAAYYRPIGSRSFGAGRPHFGLGIKDQTAHFAECNDELSVCIMVESRGAVKAAQDIAALPGIEYLSFGMNDLAQALGFPGQPGHAKVRAVVEEVSAGVHKAGKRVREDFMRFAWINEALVVGARH